MEEEKCPQCGNENLKRYEQIAVGRIVSVKTGKVLKVEGYLDITCWNYLCKCGWVGKTDTP